MDPDSGIDDELLKQEGRSGGEATAFEMPVLVSTSYYLKSSLTGGIIAGLLFLLYVVLIDAHKGSITPLRVFASLSVGNIALSRHVDQLTIAIAGLLSAIGMSLLWSLLFGLLLARFHNSWTPANIVSSGMVYGSVVWMVEFYVLAPVLWPWIVPLSSVYLFLGFVFFFGLPLGAWVASRAMKQP